MASVNLHRVTNITIESEYLAADDFPPFQTITLSVETDRGTEEIILFSAGNEFDFKIEKVDL